MKLITIKKIFDHILLKHFLTQHFIYLPYYLEKKLVNSIKKKQYKLNTFEYKQFIKNSLQ